MATVTLIQAPPGDLAVAGVAGLGAGKALRPAPLEQRGAALFFATIVFQKLRQTEPSLELNLILGHGALLVWLRVQCAIPGGSIAEPPG
jgi:hypothetical protein